MQKYKTVAPKHNDSFTKILPEANTDVGINSSSKNSKRINTWKKWLTQSRKSNDD
jgi:hypothetical protein